MILLATCTACSTLSSTEKTMSFPLSGLTLGTDLQNKKNNHNFYKC